MLVGHEPYLGELAAQLVTARMSDVVAFKKKTFQEAGRIKPDYAYAWYNTGVALGRLGDYPRAIASYGEALRLDPTNADGWVNLGVAYQTIGQNSQAITYYEYALRHRPEDSMALQGLVVLYAGQGDRARALDAYRRLRAIDPARADDLLRTRQ